jgi:hypothetical protein
MTGRASASLLCGCGSSSSSADSGLQGKPDGVDSEEPDIGHVSAAGLAGSAACWSGDGSDAAAGTMPDAAQADGS